LSSISDPVGDIAGDMVSDMVMAAAARNPDATALADEHGPPVSYRELGHRVTGLAAQLLARTTPGARVAIASHKSSDTVIAMLAALEAGRCYVPIDPAAPAERHRFILRQSGCELLLGELGGGLPGQKIFPLNGSAPDISPGQEARARRPDDEAYLLYTSGSTGQPKGVVITRRNATAFIRWAAATFPLRPGDQVAVHAPLHFDLPVYDLYVGLAGGATLHLVAERTALFPQALHRFLAERAVTHLYAVPSALTALVHRSTLPDAGLPALRQILYAGEEFRPAALTALMRAVPRAAVSNLYGPVETNVVTSWTLRRPPEDTERVPIGRPIDGVTLALLAETGEASELGAVEGEIVIAGDCVTPGYLARPDLTGQAMIDLTTETGTRRFYRTGDFARRDAAGVLHLLGRRDGLVKTRGYRVELGEIEAVIGGHPEVAEVVVVAEPDPELTSRLHAVVVAAAGRPADDRLAERVVTHCRARLPGYMVPGRVHVVADLPRTSTGKVARARLPELIAAGRGRP
jgi:L-proline---[L-prolyl-carrier protein] ligase